MSEVRFAIGDFVVYKTDGVCRISDIRIENFSGDNERDYFVLSPVGATGTVTYVPVDLDNLSRFMRCVLSRAEIDEAIDLSKTAECEWIENSKIRAAHFKDILAEGDTVRILWIIKVLSLLKCEIEKNRRKMYISDMRALEAAEKAITDEFSFVLDIPKTDVMEYILRRVGTDLDRI